MNSLDHLTTEEALQCGCWVAEDVIRKAYQVDIRKALNPLNPHDFIVLVSRLRRSISRATAKTEAEILRKALAVLDVNWANLGARARDRIINAARSVLQPTAERIIPAVEAVTKVHGTNIIRGTRAAAKAQLRSTIGVSLTLRDQRILDHATSSLSLFVRDEYGRRVDSFSRIARDIVASGLEEGLGRDAIAANLATKMDAVVGIARSENYWDVIAATFMNRSRVWGHLASIEESGISEYVFEAVMDERTTDQCAFLHGQIFRVSAAIERYQRVASSSDPESVIDVQPWVRVGRDAKGNRVLFTQARDGTRTHIANVVESRVGTRDFQGQFSNAKSTAQLEAMGVSVPPLHGRCRSTIVANV